MAKPRNTSASIRQRLLNHSTAIKTDPNLVLIWYGLERNVIVPQWIIVDRPRRYFVSQLFGEKA